MTPRENLLAAMRRQNPERVPIYFTLCPAQIEAVREKTGSDNYEEYFQLEARTFRMPPTKHQNDYSQYFTNLKPGTTIDEWGVGHEPGSVAHFAKFLHPMEDFDDPQQVWDFPLPDLLADYRWEQLAERVKACHDAGYAAVFANIKIFEQAWYLRGMDNLLCDMLTDEEMAEACIKRITDIQEQVARKVAECGFDVIIIGDDVGSQRALLMSYQLWCKSLKPELARVIAAAKAANPDILVYYHSDGVIDEIIEDLIAVGVDILNPVQPECMDPFKVKELYGDRLSFWGTLGTQTTMPFGKVEEVRDVVRKLIEGVGKGGGLCLAPSHMIEPEVPFENLLAFVETAREYGNY